MKLDAEILHLYISPGHNFFGHQGQPAGQHPMVEVPEVRCVAGQGIEGDRFFGFKDDYKGQITFFADEVHRTLGEKLGIRDRAPSVYRRNVILRGVELATLYGVEFELQGVRFSGVEQCKPCHWMDKAFGAGAEEALQGCGGLRARILSDGVLRVGRGAN
jgi:MOSC domain-containing protein YiiM